MARRTHKGAPQLRAHKPSAHLFRNHGRAFLFDPCTRTSFALDTSGEVAAREMLGGKPARRGVTAEKVASARDELTALSLRGHFRESCALPAQPSPRKHVVLVNVSCRCNLRCRYCYANHEGVDGWPPLDMPPAVMEATARLIGDLWQSSHLEALDVGVACSGEIACQFELCDAFRAALAAESCRRGVQLQLRAWSGTNLTRLSDPGAAKRVLDLGCAGASLDGPPEIHDAMRVYPDGRGTYADAVRGLKVLRGQATGLEGSKHNRVGATLTGAYPDVLAVYQHLFDLGFAALAVQLVRSKPDSPFAVGHNLDAIRDGYCRLAEWLISLPDAALSDRLRRITSGSKSSDYFGRFLERVMRRPLMQSRCPGGTRDLTVHTDGTLYICPGLAGVPEARLGSVWEGIDDARVAELADRLQVTRRVPCKDCWARFLCGGGCMHQSYLTFGDLFRPDPAECALNQHLIELAIWFYAELKEKRPTVLEHLQRPPVATA